MSHLRKKRDVYSKQAKKDGYRSRAAYKLLQIDEKFQIFKPNQTIIDLCGAPGGFSQVARDKTNFQSQIFLVDQARVKEIPNIKKIIKGDITRLKTILELKSCIEDNLSKFNEIIVLADCSPNVSGNWTIDHARQIWLAEVALGISNFFLSEKFITKVFQGEFFEEFTKKVKAHFTKVNIYKPPTSRTESAEIYIIATERQRKELKRYDQSFLLLEEDENW